MPWSLVHIANNHIDSYKAHSPDHDRIKWNQDYEEIEQFVKTSGAQVIKNKGATFYAVAMSVCHLCKCVQSTAGTALTVSTMMHGEYGVSDVCLSTLALVDNQGVRGKILNCLKADYARIFKSDVIVDLIKVMGCGVELGGKHNKELATFNLDNLRFNKIVICTDADVDGSHIEVLLLTLFYKHFSYLMETGHIYISMPPLFKVSVPNKGKKKERRIYCLNEEELKKTVEKLKKEKFTDAQIVISRFKGLGEMDWEELKETSLDPETRRLLPVKVGLPGDDLTGKAMQILMGNKEADARKQWIERHGDQFEPDI